MEVHFADIGGRINAFVSYGVLNCLPAVSFESAKGNQTAVLYSISGNLCFQVSDFYVVAENNANGCSN